MAVAWAGLVVSLIGLEQSYEQSNQAAAAAEARATAEREGIAAQDRAAKVSAQKERIKSLREARIARARVLSSAATEGVGAQSSGVSGATSSITSQFGSNIGTINQAQTFGEQASAANSRAASAGADIASHQALAQQWQMIGNLGQSAFQIEGGWKSLFSKEVAKVQ